MDGDIKNYVPLQVALVTKKRDNYCGILVDAAPKFRLYACKGCPRCKAVEDYFVQRRQKEEAFLDRVRIQYGTKKKHRDVADNDDKKKNKKEDVRAKSIETQVNQMVKESVLHAFETTIGKWTFEVRTVDPSERHHSLMLIHDTAGTFDLSSLWELFPDEPSDAGSDRDDDDESDAQIETEEDVRGMRRRVFRLLKAHCDLRKQRQPLLHQVRAMTRYCESWIEVDPDATSSYGAPETGADLIKWAMGSGKTCGALQVKACRPRFDKTTIVAGNTFIDYWLHEVRRTALFLTTLEKPSRIRRYAQYVLEKRWAIPYEALVRSKRTDEAEPVRAKLSADERRWIRSVVFSSSSLFHPDSEDVVALSTEYEIVGYQEFNRKGYNRTAFVAKDESPEAGRKRKAKSSSIKKKSKSRRTSRGEVEPDPDRGEDEQRADKDELNCVTMHERDEPGSNHRSLAIVDEPQKFRNGTRTMKVGLEALQILYSLRILTTGTLMVNDVTDVLGISCLFGAPVPEDGTTEEEAQRRMPVEEFSRLIAGRVNYYDMRVHNPSLYEKCFPTREEVLVRVPMTWKQSFVYLMSERQKIKFMGYTINTSKSNSYGMRTLMVCNKLDGCPPDEVPKMKTLRDLIMNFGRWPQVVYCNLVESEAEVVYDMFKNVDKPKACLAKDNSGEDLAELIQKEQDEDVKNYMVAAMAGSDDEESEEDATPSVAKAKVAQNQRRAEESDGKIRVALLTGKTPTHKRQKIIDEFNAGFYDLLVLTNVGTVAIDLKGGQVLHFVTPPANEATSDQIAARIVRYMSHAHCASKHVVLYKYLACFPDIEGFFAKENEAQILELQDAVYEALTRKKAEQATREQIEREVPVQNIYQEFATYLDGGRTKTIEEEIYARSEEKSKRIAPYETCVNRSDVYDPVGSFAKKSDASSSSSSE